MVERLAMKDMSPPQDHSQPATKHKTKVKIATQTHKPPSCEKHNSDIDKAY